MNFNQWFQKQSPSFPSKKEEEAARRLAENAWRAGRIFEINQNKQ